MDHSVARRPQRLGSGPRREKAFYLCALFLVEVASPVWRDAEIGCTMTLPPGEREGIRGDNKWRLGSDLRPERHPFFVDYAASPEEIVAHLWRIETAVILTIETKRDLAVRLEPHLKVIEEKLPLLRSP